MDERELEAYNAEFRRIRDALSVETYEFDLDSMRKSRVYVVVGGEKVRVNMDKLWRKVEMLFGDCLEVSSV